MMSKGLQKVMKPIRRRRWFLYAICIIIVIGLGLSVVIQFISLGFVEQVLYTSLGGIFLILAAVMFVYLQLIQLQRAEYVARLAAKHNGTMRLEYMTKDLMLPENKARSTMHYFVKRKLAVTKKEGERWTFPTLQRK
ncbi:MAG: hypothetical protein ACFFCW_40655 [Candidatus Hodarchaeota archaeon]